MPTPTPHLTPEQLNDQISVTLRRGDWIFIRTLIDAALAQIPNEQLDDINHRIEHELTA
jgi:hypothetical protein